VYFFAMLYPFGGQPPGSRTAAAAAAARSCVAPLWNEPAGWTRCAVPSSTRGDRRIVSVGRTDLARSGDHVESVRPYRDWPTLADGGPQRVLATALLGGAVGRTVLGLGVVFVAPIAALAGGAVAAALGGAPGW